MAPRIQGNGREGATVRQLGFAKSRRLVSNRQFKAVLDRGRRAANSLLILYATENPCGRPRLGISVGKTSGKAVVRNRLKRLLREAFRQNQMRVPQSFDYVVMISPSLSRRLKQSGGNAGILKSLTFDQISRAFLSLVDAIFDTASEKDQRTSR